MAKIQSAQKPPEQTLNPNAYTPEMQKEALTLLEGMENNGVHAVFYDGLLHIWFEWTVDGMKKLICEQTSPGWQQRARKRLKKAKEK